jgi:hypothetical protein
MRNNGASTRQRTWVIVTSTAVAWIAAAGCSVTAAYKPLVAASAVPAADRWQALQALAQKERWLIERADARAGEVVAWRSDPADEAIRDRIRVRVTPRESIVELQTAIRDGGAWLTMDGACGSYDHARETLLARSLEASPPPAVVAGLPSTP